MAYKHGVYTSEVETSLTAPIVGTAGLQVIVGTAPVNMLKDPAAAVNVPLLVNNYKEAVEAVGYSDDFENFTLCQSISACFQVFNVAPIILVNVLDPNKAAHVTQNQAESCDVVDGVVLYDKKYVLLNTLAVKNGSATLVAGSDYEAAHEDNGSVAITLLSTAAKEASSLTVSSTSLKPSGVTAADIVGGVDASTGSLGQGCSIAVGMALGAKHLGKDTKVFALVGDGESQEGQIWEAYMAAAHYKLDNLTVIIDNNGLQIDGTNDQVMSLGDLGAKLRAFGFDLVELPDGNDLDAVEAALSKPTMPGKPKAILAHTVKGKGVSFMENQVGWHGKAPNAEQRDQALKELED